MHTRLHSSSLKKIKFSLLPPFRDLSCSGPIPLSPTTAVEIIPLSCCASSKASVGKSHRLRICLEHSMARNQRWALQNRETPRQRQKKKATQGEKKICPVPRSRRPKDAQRKNLRFCVSAVLHCRPSITLSLPPSPPALCIRPHRRPPKPAGGGGGGMPLYPAPGGPDMPTLLAPVAKPGGGICCWAPLPKPGGIPRPYPPLPGPGGGRAGRPEGAMGRPGVPLRPGPANDGGGGIVPRPPPAALPKPMGSEGEPPAPP